MLRASGNIFFVLSSPLGLGGTIRIQYQRQLVFTESKEEVKQECFSRISQDGKVKKEEEELSAKVNELKVPFVQGP